MAVHPHDPNWTILELEAEVTWLSHILKPPVCHSQLYVYTFIWFTFGTLQGREGPAQIGKA